MKFTISIIWLIFVALFLCLGFSHLAESQKTIPPFEITKREMDKPSSPVRATIKSKGTDLDKPFEDFAGDFNAYLVQQNKSSCTANRNAAWGYFLAALTAFVSMLLEWRDVFFKFQKHKKEKSANN